MVTEEKENQDDADHLERTQKFLSTQLVVHPLSSSAGKSWWDELALKWGHADEYPKGVAWEVAKVIQGPALASDPAPVIEFKNVVMRYRPDMRPNIAIILALVLTLALTLTLCDTGPICGQTCGM